MNVPMGDLKIACECLSGMRIDGSSALRQVTYRPRSATGCEVLEPITYWAMSASGPKPTFEAAPTDIRS